MKSNQQDQNQRDMKDAPQTEKLSGHTGIRNNEGTSTNDPDELARLAEHERSKKPGSQSNSGSSGRHNNGRGGGK
jgi:hypothetical protein